MSLKDSEISEDDIETVFVPREFAKHHQTLHPVAITSLLLCVHIEAEFSLSIIPKDMPVYLFLN